MEDIYRIIPHRPPFLFVDEIVEKTDDWVVTRRTLREEEFYFQGHYPGNPIMPGVLSCESVFQTGAILLLHRFAAELAEGGTPVLTRIQNAKFRGMARPGDTLTIKADFGEKMGKFFFLKGSVMSGERKILTLDFGLAIVPAEEASRG